MDSAFSHEKKFCKEKITPLGYKQYEISELVEIHLGIREKTSEKARRDAKK